MGLLDHMVTLFLVWQKLILFRNYCNMEKEILVWKCGQFPGFLGGSVVKNLPANEGIMGSIPGWEYPTCCKATKPMHHNYWICALEPTSCNHWALVPQLLKPECRRTHDLQQEKPLQWEAQAPQLDSSSHLLQPATSPCSNEDPVQQRRPSTAKNEWIKWYKKKWGQFPIQLKQVGIYCRREAVGGREHGSERKYLKIWRILAKLTLQVLTEGRKGWSDIKNRGLEILLGVKAREFLL